MKDRWDEYDEERWELTPEALKAEGLADKIAERFWLDRIDVFDVIVGEDDAPADEQS